MPKVSFKTYIFIILSLFLNNLSSKPEWFEHKTSILEDTHNTSQRLHPKIEEIAKMPNVFGSLNNSNFFDTTNILNYKWVQDRFGQQRDSLYLEIPLTTVDNHKITLSYFQRHKNNNNKDTVILVGPGFTNPAEKMAPFVHIFQNYDVAIINYRGHGLKAPPIYKFLDWLAHKTFQVAPPTKVGAIEHQDVFTSVKFLRGKGYKRIIGMGLCYSSLIFLKSYSIHYEKTKERLFDKMILDSPWISLEAFCNKLGSDPKLIFTPQRGGWGNKWLCKNGYCQWIFPFLVKSFTGEEVKNKSIIPYLPNVVDVPLLIWYGRNDLTVFPDEFEKIWEGLSNTKKIAVITSNPHVFNHLKQKELYAMINNLFLETENHEEFFKALHDPAFLRDTLIKNNHKSLTRAIDG